MVKLICTNSDNTDLVKNNIYISYTFFQNGVDSCIIRHLDNQIVGSYEKIRFIELRKHKLNIILNEN